MGLKVYNSLTKEKEEFIPFKGNKVGLYVCGPTVYSEVHLGNIRTFVSFDIIFRYLKYLGYSVRYVRNITDVGHLENDNDEGEDKISKRAKLENLEPMEVSQKYSNDFHFILRLINCLDPNIEPLASGHIIEQINMIKNILEKGFAYESNGSVYFNLRKYIQEENYGILSGRNINEQFNETRNLEGVNDKIDQKDFALWKKASKEHIMKWDSPWSQGFPGWHLECSAMSNKYLGEKIDIHGGGIDLKFPHHECEIAQNKAYNKNSQIKYWLHSNMLTINGKKMSKSTGNVILPGELFFNNNIFDKNFKPEVVRFFMMTAHYTSILDFSKDAMLSAEKGFYKISEAYYLLEKLEYGDYTDFDSEKWKIDCFKAMNDDFNTAVLISNLFEASRVINSISNNKMNIDSKNLEILKKYFKEFTLDVMGLTFEKKNEYQDNYVQDLMEVILELRKKFRDSKNWEASDFIRDRLSEKGIEIKDGKEKTVFIRK